MEQLNKVENTSKNIQEMVDEILGDSLKELDDYIALVRKIFIESPEIIDVDLDKILLSIPTYTYYVLEIAQRLEMRKGVSKEHASFAKNEAMLNATGTVADKTAKAENQTAEDRLVQIAYNTASALVKSKLDGAMAILDSAKKVQARKLAEMRLTGQAGSAVGF